MRTLITGIDGFIGQYLAHELIQRGDHVLGLTKTKKKQGHIPHVKYYEGDIRDKLRVSNIIKAVKPKRVFHLAAQSNITHSFEHPAETMQTNVLGTLHVLEALRKQQLGTIFISVGSSAEYGLTAKQKNSLSEDSLLLPTSPYAVSKTTQGYLIQTYASMYKINAIHVRPFAIIGPGKRGDAISDFARGISKIERGQKKYLAVGNISHVRDFLDVRDAVAALELVSKKGKRGEIYNICSGKGVKLDKALRLLIHHARRKISIKKNPKKDRPADDPVIVGSAERLHALGFMAKYTFDQSLKDILDYWKINA